MELRRGSSLPVPRCVRSGAGVSRMNESAPTADEARDVRGFGLAVLIGVALGAVPGILRYGPFTMSTVHLAGLGVILVVSIWAGVIALMPARGRGATPEETPPR